mgnify:FL=1
MASSYTDSLGLEKQGSGENANTWGQRLNSNVIDLVDEAVAGYATVALTSGTQTDLTISDGASSTGRHATLEFTGNVAATVTVTIPTEQKTYAVINSVTNGGKVLVVNTGSSVGAGKIIPAGHTALLASNGSQVKTIGGEFEPGTRMAFAQAAAPTGWTVETCATYDNAALRIITASTSGTGGGTAGSNNFNSAFSTAIDVVVSGIAVSVTGDTGSTTLTISQIPAHTHTVSTNLVVGATDTSRTTSPPTVDGGAGTATQPTYATGETGGGAGHHHSLNSHHHVVSAAGSFNLNPKYVNFIVCTKD